MEIENFGITPETHVVVYDTIGVFSSPRALYTFKAFNHDKISVLDGGLPRWIHEGYEVEAGEVGNTGDSEYPLPKSNPDFVRCTSPTCVQSRRRRWTLML